MRLLILSSRTGGGHEMRAQALSEFCMSLNIRYKIVRPLEEVGGLYLLGTNIYNWIQRFYPRLHSLYFNFLENASLHSSSNKIIGKKSFQLKVKNFKPDAVLSVHAHLNHGYFDIIKELYPISPPKFMIYSGELDDGIGFSKHWVNANADLFCGPTDGSIFAATQRGMPVTRCKVLGPLLRQPFYKTITQDKRNSFLRKHKLTTSLPIGVLATGANSVNSHEMALRGVDMSKVKHQIIALCGKSTSLFERIMHISRRYNFPIIPLAHIGAEDICTLLSLSKWVFGRAGAGLTTEALTTGTEIMFDATKGIMPQEQNNLNYFKNAGYIPRLVNSARAFSNFISKGINRTDLKLKTDPELISQTILGLLQKK